MQAHPEDGEPEYFLLHYEALVRMAGTLLHSESPNHILSPAALVHEVWLRLKHRRQEFSREEHFLGTCRLMMRHILTDHARSRKAARRGYGKTLSGLDSALLRVDDTWDASHHRVREMVAALEVHDRRCALVVRLRFFSGMTEKETAGHLGVTRRTVNRDWNMARMWLFHRMGR